MGDVVPGIVTKIVDFGAFVDLGDGVEGLVHISELSDKHVTSCSEVVEVGQSYPFKVIRLEPTDKRIGLSLKEGQRRERLTRERDEETHYHQQDEGRVSLGDVVDFSGFHRNEEENS